MAFAPLLLPFMQSKTREIAASDLASLGLPRMQVKQCSGGARFSENRGRLFTNEEMLDPTSLW